MISYEDLWKGRVSLQQRHDLIHCITNPISINDCANAVLALGAKPIMAQHPQEVEEITKTAKALALNLGNFDDVRSEAMIRSSRVANALGIPMILDLVGIGCSTLRLSFANHLIEALHPEIVKGNLSEIRALGGKVSHAQGIDVGEQDLESVETSVRWIQALAKRLHCTILCSGKVDIVSDGKHTYTIENGCELLTLCTGTGCMLNVITAAFLSCMKPLEAALMATSYFGITAEKCYETAKLPGTFHMQLFDWLYALTKDDYVSSANIKEVTI